MRLIHTRTFELAEFFGERIPRQYAILSHTWDDDEVTLQDWQHLDVAKNKAGYFKVKMACHQARLHGIDYVWVDTNCIDKTSSAELSEAINSMFAWYRDATVCYAYLSDVEPVPGGWESLKEEYIQHFCRSKWFTRGWTLQELLAPVEVTFYARGWSKIASRSTLATVISERTRIETAYLTGGKPLAQASVAQKMSWVSRRVTTRVEDMAYSMLGIFDINMPLLYGEGTKAFIRLQEEIIRVSNDQTIFCWTWTKSVPSNWVSFLAPCPQVFKDSGNYSRTLSGIGGVRNYSMTNTGLSIALPVVQTWSYYFGVLNAQNSKEYPGLQGAGFHASIPVRGHLDSNKREANFVMERVPFPPTPVFVYSSWVLCQPALFIRSTPEIGIPRPIGHDNMLSNPFQYGFLIMLDNTNDLLDHWLKDSKTVRSKLKELDVTRGGLGRTSVKMWTLNALYLTERTRDLIGVETFPPGMFDPIRSLVRVEAPRGSPCASVLVRLGPAMKRCVVFLGLRLRPGKREPYRFCRVITDIVWETENLRLVQQQLEARMCMHGESRPLYIGFNIDTQAVICPGVGTVLGVVYPTYITSEYERVGWLGTEQDESKEGETGSLAAGVAGWKRTRLRFADDIGHLGL